MLLQVLYQERLNQMSNDQRILSEKLINEVFLFLISLYGNKFISNSAEEEVVSAVKNEWARSLNRFKKTDLDYAMQQTLVNHKTFPPTLPEFYSLCVISKNRTDLYENNDSEEVIKKADMETRNREMIKIMRCLGKG